MSRLEAFMVALGMILLGMAAARAEEPKLPEIIRGTGPEVAESRAAPERRQPAPAQIAGCDDVVFLAGFSERDRRFGRGGHSSRPMHREAPRARINDMGVTPAFNGAVSPTGR